MNNEIDFQYVAQQECLPSIINNQLKTSFTEHNLNVNEDCLNHLSAIVVKVIKAVGKDNIVQSHGQFDIVKGFKQEFITATDVQLLIQYDLYQQLERSNQVKNINYNTLKEISNEVMNSLNNLQLENNKSQNNKLKV